MTTPAPPVQPPDPERLDALAAAWTVLSRLLLAPPDAGTLTRVRDPHLLADWPLARGAGREATAAGLELLAHSAVLGEDEAAIRRDFDALFRGPDRRKAPPYESVHRSHDHLLFEAETLQVRAWYARHGLAAPRLNREPDDHVALEFEFLAALLLGALQALEEGRDDDARRMVADHDEFLREHPLAWVPGLMDLVGKRAATAFYRGVAALGDGTLRAAAAVAS